jgi:transposase
VRLLRARKRVHQGRRPTPSAAILDSQSVKITERGPHGYGAKKLNGRKRHLLVDTLGLLLAGHVTSADISDTDGAAQLLRRLDRRQLPRLRSGWADGGYRGGFLAWALARSKIAFQVVARPDGGRRRHWLPPGVEPPAVPRFMVIPAGGWWSGPLPG